jgi:preprotein translocase subunit SecF
VLNQQKHNPATTEQRYNTKIQQKHNPDTIDQRYNTKVQQKHNPDTIEQRYNTQIQQKHVFVVLLCCIVVLLYLDCVFLVFFVLYQCSFVGG